MPADHYEIYYADKLWNLLPAVYRAQDSNVFGANGPLREMVNRIGAQAAVLRRSIDRLWQDQSIETCDDWVVPYIADLLATESDEEAAELTRKQRLLENEIEIGFYCKGESRIQPAVVYRFVRARFVRDPDGQYRMKTLKFFSPDGGMNRGFGNSPTLETRPVSCCGLKSLG